MRFDERSVTTVFDDIEPPDSSGVLLPSRLINSKEKHGSQASRLNRGRGDIMDEHAGAQQPVRRRLGRGLNALIGGGPLPDGASSTSDGRLNSDQILIDQIEPNPFQPRKDFEPASLRELVASIRRHGVLQPLLVRKQGDRYQLIAGERRWQASKQAGLASVPCRILDLEDQGVTEAAIEENLKRKDLNALEKAQAFQDYLDRFGSSIEELAKQLSMKRATVSNYVRLLDLPDAVKQALAADRITNGHARALLPLPEADQIALCRRIEAETLSVRVTEKAVREVLRRADEDQQGENSDTVPFPDPAEKPSTPPVGNPISNHVRSLIDQLQQHLGAKVDIQLSGPEAGRIIIRFDSNDDFDRLVRHLRRAA